MGRPRLRAGREHPALADHGRRRAALRGRLRHRLQAELGGGARVGRGVRRQAVPDPRRRLRPPAGRPRVRPLGRRGGRAGARARGLLRHDRRLLGDRLDPGGDDRRVRRAGAAATRSRHRRVGHRGADPGADRADRATTAKRSASGASSPTTRSSCSTSGTRAPTASPTRRRSRRSASAPGSRGCSPTRSTRGSRWRR